MYQRPEMNDKKKGKKKDVTALKSLMVLSSVSSAQVS